MTSRVVPATKVLRAGDLVNIDVSAELDGYWADTGASTAVGEIAPRLRQLLWVTREAQAEAMAQARAGQPLNAIGAAVEKRAKKHGFRVIRTLGGHGVGRHIHEPPHVSNVYERRDKTVLWEGLVMTIEPFLTTRATDVVEAEDGWTLRTPDGSVGAQFEHTFVVTKGAPIVLT
jgi:methionyl aminopeptidase